MSLTEQQADRLARVLAPWLLACHRRRQQRAERPRWRRLAGGLSTRWRRLAKAG